MAAIIGPNDNPRYSAVVGAAHAERALNWAQLTEEYRQIARKLHELALGDPPSDSDDIGPIYTRQALGMQKRNIRFVYD